MSKGPSPRLFVVDDDPSVAAAYRRVLEDAKGCDEVDNLEAELFGADAPIEKIADWRVEFFSQGLDAVSAIQRSIEEQDPVTAIFLDVRMPPGIDGYETAKRIRQLDRDVHIVVVTAYSDYAYEDFLVVAGPADRLNYLPKPIWPHELLQVAQVLASERQRHSAVG
jgi:CheY-like chemotaxis protein